jgi:hypothetical protein
VVRALETTGDEAGEGWTDTDLDRLPRYTAPVDVSPLDLLLAEHLLNWRTA